MKDKMLAMIMSIAISLISTTDIEYYGTCKVTAYGPYAGTIGASGNTLIPNESCAASRKLPFGTKLYIRGYGVVTVEDRTGEAYENEYDGYVIDLYLADYDAACKWGSHDLEVYIIELGGNTYDT